jgi:SAM-dependent methyltransferase
MNDRSPPPSAAVGGAVDEMIEPEVGERFGWLAGLLAAGPGDRVVDLGCGRGALLAAVAAARPDRAGELIGLDASAELLRETARRLDGAAPWLVQANLAGALPLAAGSVDRVLCHNVLECLPDPGALVAEAWRILRPGGRLVLSHSDFDTLVFHSEDLALTRRLVRAYCDAQQDWMDAVDGTIGRRLADLVSHSLFQVVDVQAQAWLGRAFRPGELGYGYAHNLAATLRDAGLAEAAELDGWLAGLQRLEDRGGFLFSLNDYAVVAVRPGRPDP